VREGCGQTEGRFGKGAGRPRGGCSRGEPGKDEKGCAGPKVEKGRKRWRIALSKTRFVRNWSLFWGQRLREGTRRVWFWGGMSKNAFRFWPFCALSPEAHIYTKKTSRNGIGVGRGCPPGWPLLGLPPLTCKW